MKTLVPLIILLALGVGNGSAQLRSLLLPKWSVTLKVVDEAGSPVPEALVTVGYEAPTRQGESSSFDKKTGRTDTNGLFTVSGHSSFWLGISAEKSGCYTTRQGYELGAAYQYEAKKWHPTLKLELKKIGKPIAMYAKRVNLGLPVLGKPVGFDLTAGDYVAPHGKGNAPDLIFTGTLDKRAENDSDYELTVGFPNPGDGIQEFRVPFLLTEGSELRSPHEAPVDGYQPQWVQLDSRKPGQPVKSNRDRNRNYFFRVRTVLDEKGDVKSALYGKIYGDFMQFRYYLNPEPNSRNVEFDPKQNLLKGLKSFEEVTSP
jgi:hypothetical protein